MTFEDTTTTKADAIRRILREREEARNDRDAAARSVYEFADKVKPPRWWRRKR